MSEIKDKLVNLLDDLTFNTGINISTLITNDGLVIATNSAQNEDDEESNANFAAVSASILSISERGVEIINENKILEQIKIDVGLDENVDADFTILISRVYSNILLQLIFSRTINIGLIHFEANKVIKDIKNIVQQDTSRELFTSIGSLT